MDSCCCSCLWARDAADGSDESDSAAQTPASTSGRSTGMWSASPSTLRRLERRLLLPPSSEVRRKIVVLGYRNVGKTALVARFVENRFRSEYEPTTIEAASSAVMERNGVRFLCGVIDTPAQDEYSTLSRQASMGTGAHGYVLVYSSASRTSLDNVVQIHDSLLQVIGGPSIPMVLVAAKCDAREFREVADEEGARLAEAWGYPFVACSAKKNWHVEHVFNALLYEMEYDSGLLSEAPAEDETCALL